MSQSGFGLIEVLVAMAIGLIGMVAIMQAFAMNERYKENTIGASGAQTNGSIALFTVERDVRMAGYGLANGPALGCSTIQYHFAGQYSSPPGGGAGAGLPALILAPVIIAQGPAGASDTITTLSSSNAFRTTPATIKDNMPSTSAELKVTNGAGFELGDLAVAIQGNTCALMEITNIQDPAGHYQKRPNGTYNPPGGTSNLPGFTVGAQIISLGRPQMRRYALDNNSNLTVQDWDMVLSGAAPTVIVDEVADLQAEYGLDDGGGGGMAGDNIIDTYTTATPAAAAGWLQLQAIRLAVLARGAYERPDVNGVCTATTVANVPVWAGGAFNIPGGLPSCFRYRVFETTVPVRNMIWRSDR
jgi:type IV pilus assembly protein PilW